MIRKSISSFKEIFKETVHRVLYSFLLVVFSFLVPALFFRLKVKRQSRISRRDNFIVSGVPHESWWDIPFLARALGWKKQIRFIPRDDLSIIRYLPFLKPLLLMVNKENPTRSQLTNILRSLREKRTIGIFPEGSRKESFKKANPGVIRFSKNTGVPILPIRIKAPPEFSYSSGSWKNFFPLGLKIQVRIGEPRTFDKLKGEFKEEKGLTEVTQANYEEMAKFLIKKTKEI